MIIVEVAGSGGGKFRVADWKQMKIRRYSGEGVPQDSVFLFFDKGRERLPEVVTQKFYFKTVPGKEGLTHRLRVRAPETIWFEVKKGLVVSWGRQVNENEKPFVYRTKRYLGKNFRLDFYWALEACVLRDEAGSPLDSSLSCDYGVLYIVFKPIGKV